MLVVQVVRHMTFLLFEGCNQMRRTMSSQVVCRNKNLLGSMLSYNGGTNNICSFKGVWSFLMFFCSDIISVGRNFFSGRFLLIIQIGAVCFSFFVLDLMDLI